MVGSLPDEVSRYMVVGRGSESKSVSSSVVSDCLRPQSNARLPCPWNSPDKNTGVGCHILLQGIFPNQGLNLDFLPCRQILYLLSHEEAIIKWLLDSCVPLGVGWLLHASWG